MGYKLLYFVSFSNSKPFLVTLSEPLEPSEPQPPSQESHHVTALVPTNDTAPCGSGSATLILMEPEPQHDAALAPMAPPSNLIIKKTWDYGRSRSRIQIFIWSRSRFKMMRLRTTAI
jgi:hypothetical protein